MEIAGAKQSKELKNESGTFDLGKGSAENVLSRLASEVQAGGLSSSEGWRGR